MSDDDELAGPTSTLAHYRTWQSRDGAWLVIDWQLTDGSTFRTTIPSEELPRLAEQITKAIDVLAERQRRGVKH